jgi:hypothetical protein
VAHARIYVLEDSIASIIRMIVIGELGTSAFTVNVVPSSLIPFTLAVLTEPHGVTSQETAFFIVTAVKTSNLK